MIDPKRFGLACGILWGLVVFIMALVATYSGAWQAVIALISDLYLGMVSATIGGAVAGLVISFVDAFIGGYLLAWLYNWLENKI